MSREVQPTNGVTLLVFLITGYVIIFAQCKFTFFRDFFGAQPDLLPGMIVYAAMAFKLETVMVCAPPNSMPFALSSNVWRPGDRLSDSGVVPATLPSTCTSAPAGTDAIFRIPGEVAARTAANSRARS